jgi:2-C-methyl-D-erythritol 4-phosphate cytidylyltransferase
MLTAIIVAGGSSRRMGFDKTFALLGGRPVVAHSIAAFEAAECVAEIVVVGRADRLEELQELVRAQQFRKVTRVIAGGVQRQDSVRAGLGSLRAKCTHVAVHDAARPLVTAAQILHVFEAAKQHGAASLVAPVNDTLKRADEEGFASESLDRERVYAMQTPQIFSRELLLEAYDFVAARQLTITDEVSALQHLGRKVLLVAADDVNLKITFPADLALAELVQARRRAGD